MDSQPSIKSKIISDVPVIYQYPVLPTGCEATALTMLLQWFGVTVTKEAVADSLIKEPLPFEENGKMKGGNPYRAFVGDPYTKESFGAFHGPIAQALNKFLPDQSDDVTGLTFQDLLNKIKENKPVIIWMSLDLKELHVTDTWSDINNSEETIIWKSPEHCALLIGFDEDSVFINDPHTGKTEKYPSKIFQQRWEELGKQAVTIKNNKL